MAVAIRGTPTSSTNTNGSTNTGPAKTTGLANGDVVILRVGYGPAGTTTISTVPSGFTQLGSDVLFSDNSWRQRLYIKVITNAAGEPANWQVTFSVATYSDVDAIAFSGADNTTPVNSAGGEITGNTGTGTTATGTGFTAAGTGILVHMSVSSTGARTGSPNGEPSGMTNQLLYDGNIYTDTVAYTPGATGNKTTAYSPSQIWGVHLFAVQEPAAAAPSLPSWKPVLSAPSPAPHPPRGSASFAPITTPAAQAVTPLSWSPALSAPVATQLATRGAASFAPVTTPASVTPLSWSPVLAAPALRSIGVADHPGGRAFEASPGAATMDWEPTVAGQPLPIPINIGGGRTLAPTLTIADMTPLPLSWTARTAAPAPPPGPPVQSKGTGPIAPLLAPALSWWSAFSPPPPVVVRTEQSQISAPFGAALVAIPPLAWAPSVTVVVQVLPQPVSSTEVGPVGPLAAPLLAWSGRSAAVPVLPPPAIPSSAVGPVTPALPVPSLSWLAHVTAPFFPPPPAAFDPIARSLLPIASQVLTPMSWAPRTAAPPAPPIAGPQTLVFGPTAPLVAPALSWLSPPAPSSMAVPAAATPQWAAPPLAVAAAPILSWLTNFRAANQAPPPVAQSMAVGPVAPILPLSRLVTVGSAAVLPVGVDAPRTFAPVSAPSIPDVTWLLPSAAAPATRPPFFRSLLIEPPVVVPAPQVPPTMPLVATVSMPDALIVAPQMAVVVATVPAVAPFSRRMGSGPLRAKHRKG